MQTFLPFADFAATAQSLDIKRLGKQRVETLQIMQTLVGERLITSVKVPAPTLQSGFRKEPLPKAQWQRVPNLTKGWKNHPAVLMWKDHELALLQYQAACCNEWTARGYKDTCLEKTEYLLKPHLPNLLLGLPSFIGDDAFHESHRSNLIRKEASHYQQLWPTVSDDLPYKWPVSKEA